VIFKLNQAAEAQRPEMRQAQEWACIKQDSNSDLFASVIPTKRHRPYCGHHALSFVTAIHPYSSLHVKYTTRFFTGSLYT
jgi:hypothetical protein